VEVGWSQDALDSFLFPTSRAACLNFLPKVQVVARQFRDGGDGGEKRGSMSARIRVKCWPIGPGSICTRSFVAGVGRFRSSPRSMDAFDVRAQQNRNR